ncbi:MAG TPA: DUF1428 domain-containing protein [Allosphingosinicella sp.]|nr:DUF1428 domain-containing protein [Allosphingosinicella sp.]
MTYVEGFIAAVPAANKEAYRRHAAQAAPLFAGFGMKRLVECWASDVPDGTVTDFRKSVKAEEGEEVVFSWIEYASKEARDSASQKMMTDPRMEELGASMPFDGKRMIFGGFEALLDEGSAAGAYVDGFVIPVPHERREDYLALARKAAAKFKEYGASRVAEAWGSDIPDGKVTDFRGAVQAEEGENVVFSWIEWPSKAARDEAWPRVMADQDMQPDHANLPFDPKRMFWGGFDVLLDTNGVG